MEICDVMPATNSRFTPFFLGEERVREMFMLVISKSAFETHGAINRIGARYIAVGLATQSAYRKIKFVAPRVSPTWT